MSTKKQVPRGESAIFCEDDLVQVYDQNGDLVFNGPLDYCPYKDDFDEYGKWNSKDGNYDLPHDYKLVIGEL